MPDAQTIFRPTANGNTLWTAYDFALLEVGTQPTAIVGNTNIGAVGTTDNGERQLYDIDPPTRPATAVTVWAWADKSSGTHTVDITVNGVTETPLELDCTSAWESHEFLGDWTAADFAAEFQIGLTVGTLGVLGSLQVFALYAQTDESLYYQCALAVVDQIQDLALTNIGNNVVLQKVPLARGLTMPGCTVSTWKADSMPITQGSNLSDDVSYPVTVTLFARNERSVTSNHARMLTWRNQIASYFRNQPLTGVPEVATCVVEPGQIFARNEFESGVDKSELTLRFYTRELR